MKKRLLAATLACATLGGCAGTPDCSGPVTLAERAADERRPLAAWIGEVEPSCRPAAQAAWTGRLEAGCDPLFGFHAARTGMNRPVRCAGATFEEAWNLGNMLGEMEREQEDINAKLQSRDLSDRERRRLRQRLIVIERDRPQVEALARMEGWLPPAEVPERPAR
ncbi:MAG: hypothetical protein ACNS61_01495 [Candidatus Wenzhouxiangella sp. M2_3B_020]